MYVYIFWCPQDSCKVGNRGIERQVVLFEKLLVILKKKDTKKYTYKGHVLVRLYWDGSGFNADRMWCSVIAYPNITYCDRVLF